MNIQGPGSSFDFRKIEPKRIAAQPESVVPRQPESQTQWALATLENSKLPAVLTGGKSDVGASHETKALHETIQASTEDPVSESAEELDEPADFSSDYEPDGEGTEDRDDPNDPTEEQGQRQGKPMDALETRYRRRLLALNQLMDRLTATQNFLTQPMKDNPCELTR